MVVHNKAQQFKAVTRKFIGTIAFRLVLSATHSHKFNNSSVDDGLVLQIKLAMDNLRNGAIRTAVAADVDVLLMIRINLSCTVRIRNSHHDPHPIRPRWHAVDTNTTVLIHWGWDRMEYVKPPKARTSKTNPDGIICNPPHILLFFAFVSVFCWRLSWGGIH